MSDAAPPRTCAAHPGQPAFVSCERCARPACAYCLPESAGGLVCAECAAREAGATAIAWERAELHVFAKLWRTTRDVLTKTEQTFALLGEGSVTVAVGYAALLHLVLSVAALALVSPCVLLAALGWRTPLLEPASPMVLVAFGGAACGAPVLAALGGVLHALLVGAVFHFSARALGGTGGYAHDARVAAYALAVQVIWALLGPATVLPVIGPLVFGVALLAQLFWLGTTLTRVARAQHGLPDARARVAGFAAPALIVLTLALLLLATRFAGDAISPTSGPDVYR